MEVTMISRGVLTTVTVFFFFFFFLFFLFFYSSVFVLLRYKDSMHL